MMSHRDLLKKYMHLVAQEEGVTFLHNRPDPFVDTSQFTEEEWRELKEIESEL